MINKYVIGTPLDIRLNFWKKGNIGGSAKVEDVPCDISGYRRSVFYKTSKGVVNVEDSFCSGSTLTWQYKGTDQRITGIYTIVVILYNSDGSELIHQEFEGFGLIMPKYCNEPQPDRHIVRDAWVELYEFHPVIPEVSTITENWVVDGIDTGKSSRGSAMFAGTEISNENLVITSSISSIVSKYGKVFKKDDLYFNTSSSDIFKCVSASTIGLSCTTNWELIGNSQGVGIASFELKVRSEEDGGANIYQLTLTDGRQFQITVNNGNRGSVGPAMKYDDLTEEQKKDFASHVQFDKIITESDSQPTTSLWVNPAEDTETDVTYNRSQIDTLLGTKQDSISDLDAIREGAALGKTALQKHQDISGLATKEEVAGKQNIIADLDSIRSGAAKGATALQSYTETDPVYMADKPSIALKSEIPDISGKADKTAIVTETEGNASYAILPNVLTKLGTLAASVTLSLDTSTEESGVTNIYDIIFITPTNAPSITWPEGISWVGGSAPAIAGGKTYEVSIMDNLATYGEF